MDAEIGLWPEGFPASEATPPKKAPRKPRPSELAAKAAKKAKPAKKTKKAKAKKPAKRKTKAPKKVATSAACVRLERLDMRLSKAEKTRVVAKAKKLRRTITSVVLEAIEKIR